MSMTATLPLGDAEVEVTYTAIYEPAYVSGLPEDCYPDSSELEIESVELGGAELLPFLTDAVLDRFEELCWEHFFTQREEYDA